MASSNLNSQDELRKQQSSEHIENIYKSTCSYYSPHSNKDDRGKRRLIVVSIICFIFIVLEVTGGVLSNSIAIATDAAHLLTDFSSFMVSLTAIWVSSKPQTPEMNFGFHRCEVIGALISVLMIWVVTGVLVYMAAQRIIFPDYEIKAAIMIYVSIGGVFANLVMGITLVFYKRKKNGNVIDLTTVNKDESINIRSALIHVFGDLLQSIGVLIAGILIYFKPKLIIVDPICTFMFSILVLSTTLHIMRDIFYVLMGGFPKHLNFIDVQNLLLSIPGVMRIHNLRMWSLTMDKIELSAHVVISKGESQTDVLKNATQILCDTFNLHETTLQVEEIDDPGDVST